MATEKQLQANRENAQLSTGPVTPEGKFKSSHNAVKTGLTGQTVLLKTDDVEAYQQHVQRFQDKYKPLKDDEHTLLQDLADTEWRLLRIPSLEAGVLAIGRRELAAEFADETDAAVRASLLEAKVFLVYRRDLNNLSLQETRLRKNRATITAELVALITERKRVHAIQCRAATHFYRQALEDKQPFDLAKFGFEITLDQMLEAEAANLALEGRQLHSQFRLGEYLATVRAEYEEHYGQK